MEVRSCGGSELALSGLGLGCWQFGDDSYWRPAGQPEINDVVARAVDLGITYFDTAEAYADGESERMLGKALEYIPRDRVIIGTKVLPSNAYPEELVDHCEASLRRLNTDYIDLYIVHWPLNSRSVQFVSDDAEKIKNPPETGEVFDTLEGLQREGKIRHVGVSNFGVDQMREALSFEVDVVANQVAYNLLSRAIEWEVLPLCREHGVGVVGYSTLMQGILANAYQSIDDIPDLRTRTRHFDHERSEASRHGEEGAEQAVRQSLAELRDLAEEAGYSMAELAIRWPLTRKGVTSMLVGSTNAEHLKANVQAVERSLPEDVRTRIDEITRPVMDQLGRSIDYYEGSDYSRSR
jgi:aryl-alcohol dehydrogenase-like predicted oxidoreductase